MKRQKQAFDELIGKLNPVVATALDKFGSQVIEFIGALQVKGIYTADDLTQLLWRDFHLASTMFRLFLGLSEDEFKIEMRQRMGGKPIGIKAFASNPAAFTDALGDLGLYKALIELTQRPVTWRDILVERLMSGRGRAIKGQNRGRSLEDFTEKIVQGVFGAKVYHCRCRFVGKDGLSTEKADFAIPDKNDPRILIESKAYGATGSKQTDILGDMERIVQQKRHDTDLLLVTDGATWIARANDLRKLIEMQNRGYIARIYTCAMAGELDADLRSLKADHGL